MRHGHVHAFVCVMAVMSFVSQMQGLKMRQRDAATVKVLYAVMTNNRPDYKQKIQAQLDTWAAGPSSDGRFVAVTGIGNGQPLDSPYVNVSACPDSWEGVTCKEERIMEIGYANGVDWLMVLGEDNYVDTLSLEQQLTHAKTSEPMVLGMIGKNSNLKTFCPQFPKQLFGGGGYALNKAALQKLFSDGQEVVRAEYKGSSWVRYGDLVTSCALQRRGIALTKMRGLVPSLIMAEHQLEALIKKKPLTYHYMTPESMRWVHAMLMRKSATEIEALKSAAFLEGCCCSRSEQEWQHCFQYEQSVAEHKQVPEAH